MRLYTHQYDSENYDPAAPIIEIGVANVEAEEPSLWLTALIDSGADATMLPVDELQAAGARHMTIRQMQGMVGHTLAVEMYLLTLFVGQLVFPDVEVLAAAGDTEAIKGRNVLNQLIVTLNGLATTVEISQ